MNKFDKYKLLLLFALIINIFFCNYAYSATNSAIYYYNAGVTYQNQGRYDLAIKSYNKALNLNPKMSNARNNSLYAYISLANNYFQTKQYQLAAQNYKNALNINSKMAEIHYNLGLAYNNLGQSQLAIKSYENALKINPALSEARNNLGSAYFNSGVQNFNKNQYNQAIYCYKKSLVYDSNNADAYYNMGIAYNLMGQDAESITCYKQALKLKPDYAEADNNLKAALFNLDETKLSGQINSVAAHEKAPAFIYRLIQLDQGVNNLSVSRLYDILDLIWNDPEGQKLLMTLKNSNIPIIITQGSENTNAQVSVTSQKNTITYAGFPVFSYNTNQKKNIEVNIGENHIFAFRNADLPSSKRIYALQVVVHELCHASKNTLVKASDNAISEEITASIIGYNIASRIIRGKDLSEEETNKYAQGCMEAISKDEHRYLPVYNNFINEIQKLGVNPPYLYLYQNMIELYKSVRNNPEMQKIDSIEKMI
jgi:tetratricopeptide (TPR) repeat protein